MSGEGGIAHFDAIVVGSGPAGASVARGLTRRRKRVLILERGSDGPLKEGFGMARIINAVSAGNNLAAARTFTTGGTTAIYFAVAEPPPLEIFSSLGIDLSEELTEAKRELPLCVVPDTLLGAQALRVRESTMALGYLWKKSTMLVDLSKCRSGYVYEAKWNARNYLKEAVADGATLLTRAKAIRVLVEKEGAVGVEYRLQTAKGKPEVRQAFGTKIILAAGGAATPIILRDSGIVDVASKGFYCHPNFAVFGLVGAMKGGENFTGSGGTVIDDDIEVGDASPARAFYRMLMLGKRRWIRAFLHSKSIGVGVMVKEGLGGQLSEDGRYHKELTREDLVKLKKGEEVARQIIRHAGGKQIYTMPLAAAHIGGAVKINEHVDSNLETKYNNLHVCDGSVLPEDVKVTPTLTLICLGKYLAKQVAGSL